MPAMPRPQQQATPNRGPDAADQPLTIAKPELNAMARPKAKVLPTPRQWRKGAAHALSLRFRSICSTVMGSGRSMGMKTALFFLIFIFFRREGRARGRDTAHARRHARTVITLESRPCAHHFLHFTLRDASGVFFSCSIASFCGSEGERLRQIDVSKPLASAGRRCRPLRSR